MAHCPYEQLIDLEPSLAVIRTWPFITEVKPGIFYLRRTPFLHFHVKDERRWADVRAGDDWGAEIDLAYPASAAARKRFEREVAQRYELTCARLIKSRS